MSAEMQSIYLGNAGEMMTVKYILVLLAFGIGTAFLLPEAYGQTCSGGLGERSFTIARPPSIFGVSALAGADIALDPWPEGPLRICAGADQGNGVHPLSLMEDVGIGFSVLDTSVSCIKIFAAGSGGSIDCNGGSAYDVFSTQNSNHSGVEDPPIVTTGLGADAGPGAATLTANMSVLLLPIGSDPSECGTQDYSNAFPVAFTTATATSEVTDALPDHGTRSLTDVGSNFNCTIWTLTDSLGTLVAPVSGLDTVVGDVAAALKLVDTPLPTGPGDDTRYFLTDDQGRAMIHHGVNVTDGRPVFRVDASDFRQMASWGFNLIRLNLFWEQWEPMQGVYNEDYIDWVGQVLDWADAVGIQVILDFHQDTFGGAWGRGMPEWMVRDDGLPFEPQDPWFFSYFEPAVMAAFDHFYNDQDLKDAYAGAWLEMVGRYKSHPALVGYDLINEPFTGSATVEDFEGVILPAWYEELIGKIRAEDSDTHILFEPFAFSTVPGFPTKLPVLNADRLVYAPHMYHPTLEFGLPYTGDDYLLRYGGVRLPEGAAQEAPIIVGEWGAEMALGGADDYVLEATTALDTFAAGWTWWVYICDSRWNLVDCDKNVTPTVDLLIRTYPQRIAGEPQDWSYDPDARIATVRFAEKAGVSGPTEIFIPSARVYPEGWTVSVSDPDGTWSSAWDPERQILSVTTDPNQAEHTITVQPTTRDHFKCYKTRQVGQRFASRDVTLEDQFVTTNTTVVKPRRFCNPADKDGEGIGDPTAHVMCYKIKEPRFERRKVVVENQFGEQTLTVTRPDTLCLPAEKDAVPSDLNINHFKCYKVREAKGTPKFAPPHDVDLGDQFETKVTRVMRPKYLCTPVATDGQGIPDPEGHLMCYKIKDAPGQPRFQRQEIDIEDQFAEQDLKTVRGDCRRSTFLCVPSTKRIASPSGAFIEMGSGLLD
jgi:endoglycosylceramidase